MPQFGTGRMADAGLTAMRVRLAWRWLQDGSPVPVTEVTRWTPPAVVAPTDVAADLQRFQDTVLGQFG